MSDANPTKQVTDWLTGFDKALAGGNTAAAAAMFGDDSVIANDSPTRRGKANQLEARR